jgi:glutamate-1-semialdehyde 2,1-aminomutase
MSTVETARARANQDLPGALAAARERFRTANPASGALHEAACVSMPGGNTRTVLYYPPFPLTIVAGEGAHVRDADGHEYVDFAGEYTAGLFGHSHPAIQQAAREALEGGMALCAPGRHDAELAAILCERFPSCDQVRFCNSGTEANLMAVTAARVHTGRSHIMVFDGAYHGGVFFFIQGDHPVNAPYPYVFGRYNDLGHAVDTIERHASELAAVIVEPMMGTAGCIPAEPAFLAGLREATERHGIVLIFDEVMTSRLSSGGLQKRLGLTPDLTTFGKYIGGGFTFGAFGGQAAIMNRFDPRRPDVLPHAGTFNNNVLSMAAGLVGMRDLYTPEVADALNARGDRFREQIDALIEKHRFPAVTTGIGSMTALHLTEGAVHGPGDTAAIHPDAKALLHLEMLLGGVYFGRMGIMSLSLPLAEPDFDRCLAVIDGFMADYGRLFGG